MNAAKLTLTSTILAAALGLGLSLWATPAQSHSCKHHDPSEEHCNRGDEQLDDTGFAVILDSLTGSGGSTAVAGACTGTTDRLAKEGLGVQMFFDDGCFVSILGVAEIPDGMLFPFALEVKTKRSGVTEIRLYFTALAFDGVCNPCQADSIWVTDSLLASIETPDPEVADEFVLSQVQPAPQTLVKIHRPDRGAEAFEVVSFGSFCYALSLDDAADLCGLDP
jgi:hypothetical protein